MTAKSSERIMGELGQALDDANLPTATRKRINTLILAVVKAAMKQTGDYALQQFEIEMNKDLRG